MKPRVLFLAQEVHPIPPLKGAAVEQWIDAVAHLLTRYEAHVISVPHPARPDEEFDGRVRYHRIRVGRVYNRLFRSGKSPALILSRTPSASCAMRAPSIRP